MFCPKCRTEYIEGVVECEDCTGVKLVSELEAKEEGDLTKTVKVFTTNTSLEANFIKSLLGSNNIECYIENEHLVSINIFLSNAIPISVSVQEKDKAIADEVVKQYYKDLQNK